MKVLTQEDILKALPAVVSNLKHHATPERKELTDENIKRDLYFNIILDINSDENFGHQEKENDGTGRTGLYVKGYVRDVWQYLQSAYDLIHDQTFVTTRGELRKKFKKLIK